MTLAAGTRLGPYEIVDALGAGGMGEVYRARDTRLGRTVAVKVLPSTLAADPDFKARFEREAKSISALNHPHICTLHDVGEANGVSYLVLEHLEGETLANRLKKGPLPVDDAIELASQIANALDKAHRHGIVHRDLKPANVFLVKSTSADTTPISKLLDFGLAKIGGAARPGTVETKLMTAAPAGATQSAPLTSQGSILGTFQYMAPEQIEGQEADARTDIWAFGCVLYEMLTGKRAFEGKSQASLIASILERQPTPIAELQPMSPPALGRLVRTCLEKDPDNRFHTAHDLWLHLQWIAEGGSAAGIPAPVVATRKRRSRAMFAAIAIVLAALAAIGAWTLKPAPVVTNVVTRFPYLIPDGQLFSRTGRRFVAIAPDGTKVAYIANQQIYLRQMEELEAQPIRGSDIDPLDLTFSPDSRSIVFATADPSGGLTAAQLKKIDVAGGKAVTLCPAGPTFGLRWQGDRVLFSLGNRILSVADTGGTPETLLSVGEKSAETIAQPQLVGDGRTLLFAVRTSATFDDAQIVAQPIAGGPRKVLVNGGTDARVLSTGHLVWIANNTLYAQVIDPRSLELTGGPVPLVEGIRESGSGSGQFALSDTGTLAYASGLADTNLQLAWVDRTGRDELINVPPMPYTYPRVSPDGTKIVVNTTTADGAIWLFDLAHNTSTRLTSGPNVAGYPIWTPDGRSIVFRSGPPSAGQIDLYRRSADGTGTTEQLTNTPEMETPLMVMADGQHVLVRVSENVVTVAGTIGIVPLTPNGKREPVFAKPPSTIVNAVISPDGRWIAYQSPEGSATDEIHVRPFPNVDTGHWQISSGGGLRPMWSHSGRELFYQNRNPPTLMSLPVHPSPPGGSFTYSPPVPLFEMQPKYRPGAIGRAFDISPDDKRFLMVRVGAGAQKERDSIIIVAHWFDELMARVKRK